MGVWGVSYVTVCIVNNVIPLTTFFLHAIIKEPPKQPKHPQLGPCVPHRQHIATARIDPRFSCAGLRLRDTARHARPKTSQSTQHAAT
jgi:hypothetical protein